MKDLKIPVNSLFFSRCCFSLFSKQGYKAPFLEPQDHARMKDLKIPVQMVALKLLCDFPDPFRANSSFLVHVFVHISLTNPINHRSWSPRTMLE